MCFIPGIQEYFRYIFQGDAENCLRMSLICYFDFAIWWRKRSWRKGKAIYWHMQIQSRENGTQPVLCRGDRYNKVVHNQLHIVWWLMKFMIYTSTKVCSTIFTWWRHQMEAFSASLALSLTKASDAELWCFLWSAPKQIRWWFETPLRSLRRHFNVVFRD